MYSKTLFADNSLQYFQFYNSYTQSSNFNKKIKKNFFSKKTPLNAFALINGWVDINQNKSLNYLTKSLLHIKYIKDVNSFLFNDFLYFFNKLIDINCNLHYTDDLEENNINIFYKIKKSMYFIRIILMEYFG
jgi:hypothetical protein